MERITGVRSEEMEEKVWLQTIDQMKNKVKEKRKHVLGKKSKQKAKWSFSRKGFSIPPILKGWDCFVKGTPLLLKINCSCLSYIPNKVI